ncbi:MAG TPA: NUDIX hydrolase [Jatrophihabitans sp.]|jgi:8-oxo-dGTP pyrophosphatase MutT (NUDIX family)|uniref:NUDIX hydrolase n=1 Tax=Jatrophihabitans sp. TaxID=1932789 RepID=UPI002EFA7DAA
MSSGDGWTTCAAGHRHWGRFGAAGLLLIDDDRVVLQHRAPWTHQGDTWGIPGGARDSHEDAVAAALREAREEADLSPADVAPIGLYIDDHDGWSYTTVIARTTRTVRPRAANAESVTVRWHAAADVAGLRLHPGFAASWARLRDVPPPLFLVVSDAAAADPLLEQLRQTGVETSRLPAGLVGGGLTRLLPRVVYAGSRAAGAAASYASQGQVVLAVEPEDLKLLA